MQTLPASCHNGADDDVDGHGRDDNDHNDDQDDVKEGVCWLR